MSLTTPYSDSFQVADGVTTKFFFDKKFEPISKNYVKCEVYNADGSVVVPDFEPVLEEGAIKIVALTQPDGTVLNAPREGSIVRIYRDVPETQNTTVSALQASTAKQIVQNFDNIVAMIQELQYANEHFTLRSTLPQRDLQIDLLRDIDDQKLVYWDNEKRKLVVTNYRQDELLLPADKEDILEQANAYSDEQNAVLESKINGKLAAVDAQIDANADAIQKTREDYIQADSEIHQILNNHASELTTLRGNQASLGDQVSGIEEKIPGDASATNQLATKADLKDIDLDGYVKKSGDTMTGDLSFDVVDDKYKNIMWNPESEVWVDDITVETRKYLVGPKIVSTGFDILQQYPTYQNASVVLGGVSVESDRFYPARSDGVMQLGLRNRRWDITYTQKLNSGASGNDLIVPAEGGTLARIEDLIDLRADINEADSELQTQITAQAAEIATKQDKLIAGDNITIVDNVISATGGGGGGGIANVIHDATLTGSGTNASPLGLAETIKDEIADKAPKETVEALTQAVNGIIGDYLPLSGGTLTGALSFDVTGDTYSYVPIIVNADGESIISAMSDGTGKTTGKSVRIDKLSAVELTSQKIGGSHNSVQHIYVAKIGSGKDASLLTVPDGTGTIARVEDISDAVANIDALPDQTGNAGKVLTTDGTTASWQEPQGGGTKIIIKRYN